MPSPRADVHLDIAGTVFRVSGLRRRDVGAVRRRYRPFLATAAPEEITVAVGVRSAPRPRIGPPRVAWRGAGFDFVVGGCRATGRNGTVRFVTPSALGPLNPVVFRALASFLLFRNHAFLLHAAGVLTDRGAWLLCGPSGSGKTTIARLAGNRRVLNDDTVAVRTNGEVTAWATPFWGEGGPAMAALNTGGRIRGVAFLEKSNHFAHRVLRPTEVVVRAMPEAFLPLGDATTTTRLLDTLATIATRVPCFALSFAPRADIWDYLDAVA
jgi:hypothetical protein